MFVYVQASQECARIYSRAWVGASKTMESYCLVQSKQTCACVCTYVCVHVCMHGYTMDNLASSQLAIHSTLFIFITYDYAITQSTTGQS